MKFDLSWFTTIPGILITCGVVLLIIALIIFIITSKKNKKEESKGEVAATQNVADQIATPIEIDNTPLPSMTSSNDAAVPIGLPDEPVPVAEPTPVVAPVEPATSIPVAEPTPVVASVEPATSIPVAEPTPVVASVEPATSIPVAEPTPVVAPVEPATSIPVAEPTPVVAPVEPATSIPVAEPTPVVAPVEPATSIPVAEPTPVVAPVEEKPAIYGGVSEIIPNIDLNQKSDHQIYGGADPLENTQTLSVVSPSAPAVEPTPVVTIPTVEEATSQQSEPVINIIPSVEEVISGSNQ